MGIVILLAVILFSYFALQVDKGLTQRHQKNMYNSAIKTKSLSYYDSGSKCRRCVRTHLPVSEYVGYDQNHEEFSYTVFIPPSLKDDPPRLLVAAAYKWKEKRGQNVPVTDEWLKRNGLIRIQDYKAEYNPWYLRNVDV